MMETILQLSRRMAHNSSPNSSLDMKYSPTDSLKLSNRDNKRIERRKPNWTEAENVFLLDQFGLHREILTCKATDASTNLKKQEIWRVICQNLNQHNTLVRRTPAEVRRKWKNLVTAAKKEVWEMRHQIHLGGGNGPNGRKISELSQRVLQLHSSGGFSGGNPNGLYGTLLSAGLIGHPKGDKFGREDDKSFIPAHFTPIITLSESNNNHISSLMGGGNQSGHSPPPSPLSEEEEDDESSDSRNATEFMSDSGIYEQEGIDLRVNVRTANNHNTPSNNSLNNNNNERSVDHLNMAKIEDRLLSRQLTLGLLQKGNGGSGPRPDLDDEDDEDDGDDEGEEAMTLMRYSNHLGQKRLQNSHHHHHHQLINPAVSISSFISSAVNNNNPLGSNLQNGSVSNHSSALLRFGTGVTSYNNNNNTTSSGGRRTVDDPDQRKCSKTEELNSGGINGGDLIDATLKLRNHFIASLNESDLLTTLYKERLELQIEVLKLRKQKLSKELGRRGRGPLNRILVNGLSRISSSSVGGCSNGKYPKRRSFFRLKPKNTWMGIGSYGGESSIKNSGGGGGNVDKDLSPRPLPLVNGMGGGGSGRASYTICNKSDEQDEPINSDIEIDEGIKDV